MRLTDHFTLSELCHTSTGLQNVPSGAHQHALTVLCETLLEPLRAHLGPVRVHSGYRSPEVNAAIRGARFSQHLKGEAADIDVPGHDLAEVMRWIVLASGLTYGQVILEGHSPGNPTWIHASLGPPWRLGSASMQALVFDGSGYTPWVG